MAILKRLSRILVLFVLLYLFLVSIKLMGCAFNLFGKGFAEQLISTTSNPFVGLFIGILATSIIQSSGTTTSLIVGFVAGGVLTVRNAIPIVMGANIGTTITNTLVALGHITRREEFGRAFAGALVHDVFNTFAVIILFPLELATGFLERTATYLATLFDSACGVSLLNPLQRIVEPAVNLIEGFLLHTFNLSPQFTGGIVLLIAFATLFTTLLFTVKLMRSLVASKTELLFDRLIGRNAMLAMLMGLIFTALVRSSSITTSIVVPIVGAGILTIEQVYPFTLGANLGTTVNAIIASLTGNVAAITIAFVHALFNLSGIVVIYPIKRIRQIPINYAKKIAAKSTQSRVFALGYVATVFFIIPGIFILISKVFFK